jgi:hypothetical protein
MGMARKDEREEKMNEIMLFGCLIALFVSLFSLKNYADDFSSPPKKLIEFGWDEPDTKFMREHIAEMEQTPFDGCVFHVNYKRNDGSNGSFTWECWGNKAFTEKELEPAIIDLKNTDFHKFTHNFLRFNVTPGSIDWFDDFAHIIENAKLASKVAKESGIKGILFDIEQYNSQLFEYSKQRDNQTKSWDEYAHQVHKRGQEIMQAFQSEYPDITIFLTFGYCLPYVQMGNERKLAEVNYGLLAPLLDGMVDSALSTIKIVDGFELAYSYKDISKFALGYKMMEEDVLKIINADHNKYRSVFSFGFGIWMDCNWREKGWDTLDFNKNFYNPDEFNATLKTAIKTSDEYVWIYTESPKWWTASGKPDKLPKEYVEAVINARK